MQPHYEIESVCSGGPRSGETRNFSLPVTRLVDTRYSLFVTLIVTRYWVAVEYAAALQCSALQAKRVVTRRSE